MARVRLRPPSGERVPLSPAAAISSCCAATVTYDQAPKRAVANDISTTEDMLALGLESRMAGDFGVTGDGPAGKPVPSQYQAGFASVSWEQVAKAQPQCIINDYGTPTTAQKETFLETSPIARNLPAVKNHCFLALAYDEVTPGPRNAEAAVAIARWLHPTSFGLLADGS